VAVLILRVMTVFVFATHAVALWPFVRALARRRTPSAVDFACLSVVMYYDLGLVVELLGAHDDRYFPSFFSLATPTIGFSLLFLLIAPWAFRAGELIVSAQRPPVDNDRWSRLRPRRRSLFYVVTAILSLAVAALGVRTLLSATAIWEARDVVGRTFGPLIIVLYFPIFVLAFFVRQRDARTFGGVLFLLCLIVLSIVAAIPIGERSLLILPLLIPLAFRQRMSLARVSALGMAGILAASLLLPILKWQFSGTRKSVGQLVLETIDADFSRSSVLATAVELSKPAGTGVLRYPFEGYVYAALLFVPRPLVPWKGQSTPVYYTARMTGISVEDTQWMYGIGVIESAALNGGLLAVLPVLLASGLALAGLDRLAATRPSLTVPARMIGLWTCTYDISALLLLYGGMLIVAFLLDETFVR